MEILAGLREQFPILRLRHGRQNLPLLDNRYQKHMILELQFIIVSCMRILWRGLLNMCRIILTLVMLFLKTKLNTDLFIVIERSVLFNV
ncbi:hypothetical protein D3C85_1541680 [compost metagenome]